MSSLEETVIQSYAYTPVSSLLLSFSGLLAGVQKGEESGAVPQFLSTARDPSYAVTSECISSIPQSLCWPSASWPLCPGRAGEGGVRSGTAWGGACVQEADDDLFLGCDLRNGGFSNITHCHPTSIWTHAGSSTCCRISSPWSLVGTCTTTLFNNMHLLNVFRQSLWAKKSLFGNHASFPPAPKRCPFC